VEEKVPFIVSATLGSSALAARSIHGSFEEVVSTTAEPLSDIVFDVLVKHGAENDLTSWVIGVTSFKLLK
jgi:hypothetical protein